MFDVRWTMEDGETYVCVCEEVFLSTLLSEKLNGARLESATRVLIPFWNLIIAVVSVIKRSNARQHPTSNQLFFFTTEHTGITIKREDGTLHHVDDSHYMY